LLRCGSWVFLLCLLWTPSLSASPAVWVEGVMGDAADVSNPYRIRLLLTSQKYRFDSIRGEDRFSLVYDRRKTLLRIMDHSIHRCREVAERDFMAIQRNLGGNFRYWERKYLAEEARTYPSLPERWSFLVGMMQDWVNSKYGHESSGVTLANWSCETYEGTKGGARRFQVWSADKGSTGLSGKQEYWFEAAGTLCRDFSRVVLQAFNVETSVLEPSFKGVPVAFNYWPGNGKRYYFMAKSITVKDVPDEEFEPPAGMKVILLFRQSGIGGSPQ